MDPLDNSWHICIDAKFTVIQHTHTSYMQTTSCCPFPLLDIRITDAPLLQLTRDDRNDRSQRTHLTIPYVIM